MHDANTLNAERFTGDERWSAPLATEARDPEES